MFCDLVLYVPRAGARERTEKGPLVVIPGNEHAVCELLPSGSSTPDLAPPPPMAVGCDMSGQGCTRCCIYVHDVVLEANAEYLVKLMVFASKHDGKPLIYQ